MILRGRSIAMKRTTGRVEMHVLATIVKLLAGVFVCAASVSSAALAQTAPPVFTIDAPGAGTGQNQGTFVTGINNNGWYTGYYFDATLGCHAFVDSQDGNVNTFSTFDGPDNPSCPKPTSIKSERVVTGVYWSNNF